MLLLYTLCVANSFLFPGHFFPSSWIISPAAKGKMLLPGTAQKFALGFPSSDFFCLHVVSVASSQEGSTVIHELCS